MTELGVQKKLGKSGVYVQVLEMSSASLGRWEQKNQYCMKMYSSRINYITLLTNNNFNMVLVPSSVRITEPESNRYRNILDTSHILSHSSSHPYSQQWDITVLYPWIPFQESSNYLRIF